MMTYSLSTCSVQRRQRAPKAMGHDLHSLRFACLKRGLVPRMMSFGDRLQIAAHLRKRLFAHLSLVPAENLWHRA